MKTIGLTGGIGTGKSTVGKMLSAQHGVPVIDADQVSRDVVAPGMPALSEIAAHFGEVIAADGTLDRRALREIIMAQPARRAELESIVHPRIFEAIRERLATLRARGEAAAVVEAALMVETGSYRQYDALIVVSAQPETQITRVMARDQTSRTQAARVLKAQLPLAEKEAVATWVIRNDGTLDDLAEEVDRCWAAISPAESSDP